MGPGERRRLDTNEASPKKWHYRLELVEVNKLNLPTSPCNDDLTYSFLLCVKKSVASKVQLISKIVLDWVSPPPSAIFLPLTVCQKMILCQEMHYWGRFQILLADIFRKEERRYHQYPQHIFRQNKFTQRREEGIPKSRNSFAQKNGSFLIQKYCF